MSGAQVLLVEDDPDHRRALAMTLRLGGYATRECGSGGEALAQLGEFATNTDEFDAVVLDVRLPDIDGVEVLTRIRGEMSTRSLPVVLVSAHSTIPDSVQGDEHASFVPKPFHPDQLLDRLSELLPHTSEESPR